jgi:hypothetical protein
LSLFFAECLSGRPLRPRLHRKENGTHPVQPCSAIGQVDTRLPNVYLAQNLELVKSVPDSAKKDVVDKILKTHDALVKITEEAIGKFAILSADEQMKTCANVEQGEVPIGPALRNAIQ